MASEADRKIARATRAALWRDYALRFRAWTETPAMLISRPPSGVIVAPPDILNGDAEEASALYGGTFTLAGYEVETGGHSPFVLTGVPEEWLRALHGFGWLRHARAAATSLSGAHARALTSDWFRTFGQPDGSLVWEPLVAATRLRHWLSHSPVLLHEGDPGFNDEFMRQIAQHLLNLRRNVRETRDPLLRLRLVAVQCIASLALPTGRQEQRRLASALETELGAQILPDGGHVSRRAAAILEITTELLPLRECYQARGQVAPRELLTALDRMLPTLRFHRHADGTLASHNGTANERSDWLEAVLALDPSSGKPAREGRESGYQRLAMGGTVVVADAGSLPPVEHASAAHAGSLSFEMSSGEGARARRFVVNLGHIPHQSRGRVELPDVLRFIPAHSTLALEGVGNPWRTLVPGPAYHLFGPAMVGGPGRVTVRRADAEDGSWRGIGASHDAYAESGAIHERTLTLIENGNVLRGQDRLSPPPDADGQTPREFGPGGAPSATIRFHLHPAVSAWALENVVTLEAAGGDSWRFECASASPRIEPSLYCNGAEPEETSQIVISIGGDTRAAQWSFSRIAPV